jgi:hypothetical protein
MEEKINKVLNRFDIEYLRLIETGKGWLNLISELDENLTKIDPNYKIYGIKEKFGELRYSCSLSSNPDASKLINNAVEKSRITCEQCGDHGKEIDNNGWIIVRCEKCCLETNIKFPTEDDS